MSKLIKVSIHSVVDLITNSSTTVFIYQDTVKEAKDLVQEMLNLCAVKDKTPDDIFYYGVFPELESYFESLDDDEYDENEEDSYPEGIPKITHNYGTPEYEKEIEARSAWAEALEEAIIKGETEEPDWMENARREYNGYARSTYLIMIAKDEKYEKFGAKISDLLNAVTGEGYRDG